MYVIDLVSGIVHSLNSTLRRRQDHRTFAIGLLGPTNISKLEDKWMVADHVGLRKLIGAAEDGGLWLCATPRTREPLLLGDPECDRIVLQPAKFATCVESMWSPLTFFVHDFSRR